MVRYRPNVMIIQSILENIQSLEGANISQLVTHANIPHRRLKSKLEEMREADLINELDVDGGKVYILTERGSKALLKLRELTDYLLSVGIFPREVMA